MFLSEELKTFFYWMREREAIRVKKDAGKPKPWTKDEILQSYRFCNVFREEDTVTKDIRRIFLEHEDTDLNWFVMSLARQINYTETLEEIQDFVVPFKAAKVKKIMHARKDRGEKVYTSAYMLTNAAARIPKIDFTVDLCLAPLWAKRKQMTKAFLNCRSLEGFWSILVKERGFGPFLAYEVVTDLRHTSHLENAGDIHTWANAGPGALRGLNRLTGEDLTHRWKPEYANYMMMELQRLAGHRVKSLGIIEMRDIEHSLCEFDKYMRVKLGQGTPRQKYLGK